MKEQQVQRYESTDYAGASLKRLNDVAEALGMRFRVPIEAAPGSGPGDLERLQRRLRDNGLDSSFLQRRFLPTLGGSGEGDNVAAMSLAARVGRVFGIDAVDILRSDNIELPVARPLAAAFKMPANASREGLGAYTEYVHYLCSIVVHATPDVEPRPLPESAESFREAVLSAHGRLDLHALLRFLWDEGIAVLPLSDHGRFHGAYFKLGGRSVIVLKQRVRHASRWLFDLLHETKHAIEFRTREEALVIDAEDGGTISDAAAEEKANDFAGDVLLAGRAEELAHECAAAAGGSIPRLKSVVPRVAEKYGVDVAALANYLAFRLSEQGQSWWGAAANLQGGTYDPWSATRDVFLERVDFRALNTMDRALLVLALQEAEPHG